MAEWEKIFANDTTNKGLISKIYKRLITTQFEKPNNPMQKIDNGPKQTFLQRKRTDGPQAHKKILNNANFQNNANQNHNDVSPPTSQNDHQNVCKQ